MNESIKKYVKVGIISFMAFPATMKGESGVADSIMRIAKDDYFDAVEISWTKDAAEREKVKNILAQSHLAIGYGAQPRLLTTGLNLNHLDEGQRRLAVNTMLEGIDEAYEIGAGGFGFLSGKYDEAKIEEAFGALLESVREMCAYAKSKGNLKILLEVFDYDVDKCSLIGPTGRAKRFAEAMKDYDNFGLMVDLSHVPLQHETIAESIYPVRDYIKHAHIGNAVIDPAKPAYGDAHPRFGFPGSVNDVDEVAEYLRALIDIGYLSAEKPGIVSFEVKPFGDEDPELIIANAKRTLNAAWAKV